MGSGVESVLRVGGIGSNALGVYFQVVVHSVQAGVPEIATVQFNPGSPILRID